MKAFKVTNMFNGQLGIRKNKKFFRSNDEKRFITLNEKQSRVLVEGEYLMYNEAISIMIKSKKLKLEMVSKEQEAVGSPENTSDNSNIIPTSDVDSPSDVDADAVESQEGQDTDETKIEEERIAEEKARAEAEAKEKVDAIKAKKKECNKLVAQFRKIPKADKEKRLEIKSKIDSMKEEIKSLEG